MDAIIFTDTWGRYFYFDGEVAGVVMYQKEPTCGYCCCVAATAADASYGALYWCCSIFTAAAAARGAPAAALHC